MASHKKSGRSRLGRKARERDAESQGSDAPKRRKIGEILDTTKRRVLSGVAAVGTVAGAIAGVHALLPKPQEALEAKFGVVSAYPDMSLEQYDARSSAGDVVEGVPSTQKTGAVLYRLAADTSSSASEGTTASTATSTSSTPTLTSTTPTTTSKTPIVKRPGSASKRHVGHKHAIEAPTTTTPETGPAPERPAAISSSKPPSRPPKTAFHHVAGALVAEGTGAPKSKVTAVAEALSKLSQPEAEPPDTATEPSETSSESGSSGTETGKYESAPTPPGAPAGGGQATPTLALSNDCQSSCGGARQEIEKVLTYDPNPARAAEAVAALFRESRADVTGHQLHPIGAMISYTVSLDGFAGKRATLEWTLFSQANMEPPPRPWWRNVVVAHIEPTVNHETLSGTFWVPVPPHRGDYLVHMVLLDASGIPHATSDAEPAFH